ncbi:hypothetical protein [Asticcacaulis sp. W401b]|uniref:hypothetical protein n=1 Tax=Asticcacaulis sp. W401b TaxID=3388666 RepID=UPI003970EA26
MTLKRIGRYATKALDNKAEWGDGKDDLRPPRRAMGEVMDQTEQPLAGFRSILEAVGENYRTARLHYVAHRVGDRLILLKAIVNLWASDDGIPLPPRFEIDSLKVGRCSVRDLYPTVAALIDDLMACKIKLPVGEAEFPTSSGGRPWVHFYPTQWPGLQANHRQVGLQIVGDQSHAYMPTGEIDWTLKACHEPYENLGELLFQNALGTIGAALTVDIYAGPLAWLAFDAKDTAGRAVPTASIPHGQDRSKVSLGYRVHEGGHIVARGRVSGDDLIWHTHNGFDFGRADVQRRPGSFLYGIASYDGVAQQFGWLTDAAGSHNARRRAFEVTDENVAVTHGILSGEFSGSGRKGVQSRDLETAVSAVFWMLGFSTLNMGSVPKLQDAADLLITTPSGQILLVECTITVPTPEKLGLLNNRAKEIRRSVDLSGHQGLKIIPVLATCEPNEDIGISRETAERHGILVLAREELLSWLDATQVIRNPDEIFGQFAQKVEASQGGSSLPRLN